MAALAVTRIRLLATNATTTIGGTVSRIPCVVGSNGKNALHYTLRRGVGRMIREFSSDDKVDKTAALASPAAAEDVATTLEAAEEESQAHTKVEPKGNGLFPWRSSPFLLDRFILDSADYKSKGLLLGGNVTTSNPLTDFYATAYFFLQIPFLDLLFSRKATERELTENMAYAFQQSMKTLIENPPKELKDSDMMQSKLADLFLSAREFDKEKYDVKLEIEPITLANQDDDDTDIDVDDFDKILAAVKNNKKPDDKDSDVSYGDEKDEMNPPKELKESDMMQSKLADLFLSAREFDKEKYDVKLEIEPLTLANQDDDNEDIDVEDFDKILAAVKNNKKTDDKDSDVSYGDEKDEMISVHFMDEPQIMSMFVLPFLSRNMTENTKNNRDNLDHVRQYRRLLTSINTYDGKEVQQFSSELMEKFLKSYRKCENTVICQVLIPCRETFVVKDKESGDIVRGSPKSRYVVHLVRFEQVTKTHMVKNRFFPALFPFKKYDREHKILR
eukprot:CAMPEP_0194195628 /NCGR_PEP_ID=MMETSP0154-20130528/76233_1 /TAXON_ID=1049557 /ORGANISM="Thalassiothrix antarctica, Strain L6-D1" /LENGTH=501 /DNA_ID=CAMNT_0038920169 /DNA_START=195 /DNA_END=1700 /DNA_ORIENTATION=-